MNKLAKRISIVGAATGIVAISALSTPSLSTAQEAVKPVAEWLELSTSESTPLFVQNNHCNDSAWWNEGSLPVKVGVSYKFAENHPSFLDWTTSLLRNPSEAVAKREVYAVNVSQFSPDNWQQVVKQAALSSDDNLRLSVIMTSGYGYVGTPIKWDEGANDAIASSLKASELGGFKQNELAKAYASALMANSLDSFGTAKNAVASDVVGLARAASAASYFCGGDVDVGSNFVNADVYIGFSFPPQIDNISIQALTTVSGVGGERLGLDVPSWPYADRLGE